MKTLPAEKDFIDKVSAISGYDSKIVKEIFNSIFLITVREIYAKFYNKSNEIKIIFPYLFEFIIDYVKVPDPETKSLIIKEKYQIKTNDNLHEALVNIVTNNKTVIEKILLKEITKNITNILS